MPSFPPFPISPRPLRQMMSPLETSAQGMSLQQRFIEVIAKNLANAETTNTPEGGPYRREIAVTGTDPATGATVTRTVPDPRPGRMLYDPGHPDADASGFVAFPNVDPNTELVDLLVARRMHEANATVFQAAKSMLRRAIDI